MSVADYLAFEHDQSLRHEFVDGYVYAMTGASEMHERISANLLAALVVHLRGKPCRAYKGDLKIAVGEDHYYPDVFVTSGADNPSGYVRTDPTVIIEVQSRSTSRTDRGEKRLAYRRLPSLREYVLVWQDRTRVEVHGVDGDEVTVLEDGNDVLLLPSIEFGIGLADVYV